MTHTMKFDAHTDKKHVCVVIFVMLRNSLINAVVLPDKVPGFHVAPPDNRLIFEKMMKLLIIKTNMMVKLVISG